MVMPDAAASEHLLRCCSRCHALFRKEVAFCPSDGGEIELVSHDLLIGTDLEHYTIDALIGEGAMGRVYRAHHKTLVDKVFAVKVLIGDLASAQAMRLRFVNEAKNAGRLAHPNVASVVDFGRSSDGLIYLVMELVDGLPLSTLIDAGPLDPERVARLGRGIARGLHHAHQLGIVHRDLKPENVIVKTDETGDVPKIVDFGIALSIESSDIRLTSTGIALGTPGYVAPEQISGAEIDARADQYALGVTLYEALTGGNLPFVGDPEEVVTAKIGHQAPPIAERMPEGRVVPPGLARIVEKMIARRRRHRFDDLGEVIAALDRWIDHRGGDTDVVALRPPRRRIGTVVALGAVGALATTVVAWTLTRTPEPVAAPPSVAIAAPVRAAPPPPIQPPPPATVTPSAIEASPVAPTQSEPEIVIDPEVAHVDRPTRRPAGRRPSRTGKSTAAARDSARPPLPPPPPQVAETSPSPISPPPPPKPPVQLQAKLLGVDVQGSLSQAVIQRAVERVRPLIERCTAEGTPYTVRVQFTIDESRRAHGVRGSGSPAATNCVVGALGGVRTETAPDTGDAEVVVRIAFGTRS